MHTENNRISLEEANNYESAANTEANNSHDTEANTRTAGYTYRRM